MPNVPSSRALPTPESCSSCGELIAPPHRMTSAASTCSPPRRPSLEYSTPVALVPENSTLLTIAPVRTVRFGLCMTGCRYATAAL